MPTFNDRIKQVLLLMIIILLAYLVIIELTVFLPGLLGALTLYILSRANYFQLIYHRKWKKGGAAGLFIIYYLFLLGLPIYLAITLISPKINAFLADPNAMIAAARHSLDTVQQKIGFTIVSEATLTNSLSKLTAFIPSVLNSTANLISNLAIMLFILYFMLTNGREIERMLNQIIPLKQENINMLAAETKKMVRANALGIPLISIIQGLVATLGYFIFGVKEWGLWGFLTGAFAFFPVVGTMVVWVPMVIYMFAVGDTWNATWITLYSIVVTGNVDYIARITIMKRMGDVHPVITILGVIVGLGLFGFIGLVFGPLLISYIIVLFKIYMSEFVNKDIPKIAEEVKDTEEAKLPGNHS
ncbi:AI-2E family transporter [Terrimonas sp. NA20]|uniref:AI-2E family transporter n=1 Tax=Terrimonas ginsenosidimutans TaxID=2908004 RepID=A0ABS9KXU6_9BACT|nr:AI-2E family transporter [Terrimonas ginsenosidimutans]MCG2617049.1 AI-2E family transporter [Terrimonas ginsenosidimutans]